MLSIVCPVYNEADNIEKLVEEVDKKIQSPLELIVVYDFAEDNTLPVLKKIVHSYEFEIRSEQNHFGRGALNAIKTGFECARGETVLVTMADLSDDLGIVDAMYRKIHEDGFDIVCGSRYMRGGKQVGGPLLKKFLSSLAGKSLYLLRRFPTHDVTNSFKMYRKQILEQIAVQSQGGFEIGMELVVKAFLQNCKITEIPTTWIDRTSGSSKFQMWKWMPSYLRWYIHAFNRRKK
ncbi:glycosyltransferase [Candidatus Uabimicrobium amorphum]|uniref:Polyprenol phosphate mannosyl transferase 1(Ppm1) n=1 Tax=Uabimicrobium amorphum TaxID=2596890 RepID=A0A5S9F152_UABAM|nr:glycosyltransferase [Candidatus Uabimicrobium amorphum]BBM82295.1 polyprenol phosphate mannosyl transferase 1(Ppm1) [Candidatus Uabimicrobium amorphum]